MILEELEIESHQAGEFFFERTGLVVEAVVDCLSKGTEVGVVTVGQATAFC